MGWAPDRPAVSVLICDHDLGNRVERFQLGAEIVDFVNRDPRESDADLYRSLRAVVGAEIERRVRRPVDKDAELLNYFCLGYGGDSLRALKRGSSGEIPLPRGTGERP